MKFTQTYSNTTFAKNIEDLTKVFRILDVQRVNRNDPNAGE